MLLAAWGAIELGLAIYDAYSTADTILDPCASTGEKWVAAGGFALGTFAPGGGYGTAGKAGLKAATRGAPPVNILPSSGRKFIVDAKGNTLMLKPGETLTGSPDGKWLQARDAYGNPIGMRLDGGHKPSTHPDPRAQVPHAHVPGVTNPDGTPWLPVNQ